MIVDTHLHPVSPDVATYPRLPTARFQGVNTGEDMLAQMQRAGVDRVFLVQFYGVYGIDNAYVADCVARHPEAFVGIGCIDPVGADAAASVLYWVRERGIRGLRLFVSRDAGRLPQWPNTPAAYTVYETAAMLNVPVCLQVQSDQVANVAGLLQRFPTLPIILDHCANVPVDPSAPEMQGLVALASFPNMTLKYSTQNFVAASEASMIAPWLRALAGAFGAERLMWGSNYPVNKGAGEPYADLIAQGREVLSGFAPSEVSLMLGGTAERVFAL